MRTFSTTDVGKISSMGHEQRIEGIVGRLPEAVRVDIEAWDGEPTFRVNGKNFVFAHPEFTSVTVKLPKEEATATVASDKAVTPCGYGLGKHGWVSVELPAKPSAARWQQLEEWIRTSYTLVAPKKLARLVLDEDGIEA
jgi:predicted DNA-binding protein (MmcQ/YjbR family)